MSNKRRSNSGKSLAPVIQMITIFIYCVVMVVWAGINCFVYDSTHHTSDVIIFVLTVILTGSLYFIDQRLMSIDILTRAENKNTITFNLVKLYVTKKFPSYTSIFLNIRDFTYINKMYGSRMGDFIMRSYVKELKKAVGYGGHIARLGGDNFLILLKNSRTDYFIKFLEKVNISFQQNGRAITVPVYCRCGVHYLTSKNVVGEAFSLPQMALNLVKTKTSSYYLFYDEKYSENIAEEQFVFNNYKKAIEEENFLIYFQPKVNVKTNTLCGAEALVRWEFEGKIKPPITFIPAMERLGIIPELDFYVFEQTCKKISEWTREGIKPVIISTNFSKLSLRQDDFLDHIVNIINKYGVDKRYIRIEFTESSDIENHEAFLQFLKKMKSLDISTSIDDFGIGYSSLALITNPDVQNIKLDKSFIDNIVESEPDAYLVEKIVDACNKLDKQLLCEGVETIEQRDVLQKMGCEIIQGYLFDKPLTEDVFISRLKNPDYYQTLL